MSLSIHDIERSVGVDLLRRPVVASVINASILRFYLENLLLDPAEALEPTPKDVLDESPSLLRKEWVGKLVAVTVVVLTHIVAILGVVETAIWITLAILFKLIRMPRVYSFEKLILDIRVLIARGSVRYIDKKIRFCRIQTWAEELPRMEAHRQGVGAFTVTTMKVTDGLSRDSVALLRLIKYWNGWMIPYFGEDTLVFVGQRTEIVDGLCELGKRNLSLDLGWHLDVVEGTIFHMYVEFTRDLMGDRESEVSVIGRRFISVLVEVETTTASVELMSHAMDEFAAVCETSERGTRPFNGKRLSIYMIGLVISVALIVFYEGSQGLWKPSVDVLTLAIGAYTLWMTVGKSAALGDTHERAEYDVVERKHILMAFHGLASLEKGLQHVCWVPEIYRPVREQEDEENDGEDGLVKLGTPELDRVEGITKKTLSESGNSRKSESFAPSSSRSSRSSRMSSNSRSGISTSTSRRESTETMRDGSISVLEAALCLSIFRHFGHFVKWKSEKLTLDRYVVIVEWKMAHIEAVERMDEIQDVEDEGGALSYGVTRIGGNGRAKRRRAKLRRTRRKEMVSERKRVDFIVT